MTPQVKPSARAARRRQTRERILGAAFTEFMRAGMAGADVNAIAAAAGVAHGTFSFHFPSKEHVLLELECREEARLAGEFAQFLERAHDLVAALTEIVGSIKGLEQRLGPILFKELLALHFSPTRPNRDEWTDHPLIVLLVREIERVRRDGEVHPEVDGFYSATFFLLGVYGVLSTTQTRKPGTRCWRSWSAQPFEESSRRSEWTGSGRSCVTSRHGAGQGWSSGSGTGCFPTSARSEC